MSKQQNKYKEKKYTSNKDEENKDLTKETRKKGNKILNEKIDIMIKMKKIK